MAAQFLFDGLDNDREERVGNVRHDHAHRSRRARPESLGDPVGAVVEAFRSSLRPGSQIGVDGARPVQGP